MRYRCNDPVTVAVSYCPMCQKSVNILYVEARKDRVLCPHCFGVFTYTQPKRVIVNRGMIASDGMDGEFLYED